MRVECRDSSAAGKEHFLRVLRFAAHPPCGRQGRGYLPAYPALSRSVPRRTRDESARAGLHNFAPSQKRTGLVHRRFGHLASLKCTALVLTHCWTTLQISPPDHSALVAAIFYAGANGA